MELTTFGKVFVGCAIVFGVAAWWLALRMVRRMLGEVTGSRSVAIAFWTLVNFCMLSLFFPFTYLIGKSFYALAVFPAYEATVVAYESAWDTCESQDNLGRTRQRKCRMYTATLEIVLPDGQRMVLPNDIRSENPPKIGTKLSVVYPPGASQFQERSPRSIGLLAGVGVMMIFIGYSLYLIVAYGAGRNIDNAIRKGIFVIMYGLVPTVVLLMEIGFWVVPYRYWMQDNPEQWSMWEVVLCSLFAVALLPLLLKLLLRYFYCLRRSRAR